MQNGYGILGYLRLQINCNSDCQFRAKSKKRREKQQQKYTSPGEKSSSTEDKISSEREDVKHEVIRPTPFAADQRTTVSCINIKIKIKQEVNGKNMLQCNFIHVLDDN